MMSRDFLIALHAASGVIGFITGVLSLVPANGLRRNLRLFSGLFLGALIVMLLLLIVVISIDWPVLGTLERVIFGGLTMLASIMVVRALQASQLLSAKPSGWQAQYVDHVGFNLISLFEGFAIVSAIDLGVPGWLVGLIAVAGVFAGRWLVHLASSRFASLSI